MTELIAVMIGGALGSASRYLVGHVIPATPETFPWATFSVNLAGAFVLGVLSGIALRSNILSRAMLLLLGTGFCGGFTTFSTFSAETLQLIESGHHVLAGTYVAGSVVGALATAAMGHLVARHSLS